MIASISGVLKTKLDNNVIIDVNGIGYNVNIPNILLSQLGEIDDIVSLYTDLQIKDEKIVMYGFLTTAELNMFRLLQSIQGIGPKASLSILSALNVEQIILGITSSDKTIFLNADGIGNRVATRIVSELQDKISQFNMDEKLSSYISSGSSAKKGEAVTNQSKEVLEDCVSAIVNLGYSRSEAYKAVINTKQDLINNDEKEKISIEKIVPLALKKMSG